MVDAHVELARPVPGLLALLVDRGRDALRDLAALRVDDGHDAQELHVAVSAAAKVLQVELE
jgi:hypothetical protein